MTMLKKCDARNGLATNRINGRDSSKPVSQTHTVNSPKIKPDRSCASRGGIYRRVHDGTFSVAPAHHHTRHLRLFLNRGHIEAQRTHGCHSKSSTRPEGLAWRGPECRIAEQRPNFRGEFLRKLRLRFKLLVHRQCHCRTPCNRFEGAHRL
jgi:hypothetical protein